MPWTRCQMPRRCPVLHIVDGNGLGSTSLSRFEGRPIFPLRSLFIAQRHSIHPHLAFAGTPNSHLERTPQRYLHRDKRGSTIAKSRDCVTAMQVDKVAKIPLSGHWHRMPRHHYGGLCKDDIQRPQVDPRRITKSDVGGIESARYLQPAFTAVNPIGSRYVELWMSVSREVTAFCVAYPTRLTQCA